MFTIDEKHLYPMGKPNPDTGMFPPPCHPHEPHHPPHHTLPETVEMLMAETRATCARLLEFERRLEHKYDDMTRQLTSDNVIFKNTFAEAHRQFIQEVKNEVNIFEGNMNAALTLFQKTMEAEINADLEKQNKTINEAVSYMKDNLAGTVEDKLNEMEESGELTTIINNALNSHMVEYYGAVGDGVTDDTTAIQTALNSTDRVVFGAGKTYAIKKSLSVPSNVEIDLQGATVVNKSSAPIDMFVIEDAENVSIRNGAIKNVWLKGFESAQFIVTVSSSRNVTIENVRFANCISDAVYIGYQYYYDGADKYVTENIKVTGCHFDNIGRNGISLISGDNVLIENNVFENITNNDPRSGIDIEPETGAGHRLHYDNVQICNNMFKTCTRGINIVQNGLVYGGYSRCEATIVIVNNTFDDAILSVYGEEGVENGFTVHVEGSVFRNNGLFGIKVLNNPLCAPLVIKNTTSYGTVRDNTDYSYYGFITLMTGNTQTGNVTIDGLTLKNGADYEYNTAICLQYDLDGGDRDGLLKNIHIYNVDIPAASRAGLFFGQDIIDYATLVCDANVAKTLGSYYQQLLGRYTDVVLTAVSASTTHTVQSFIRNKVCSITVLSKDSGVTSMTLKAEGGAMFASNGETTLSVTLTDGVCVIYYMNVNGKIYVW